MKRARSWLSWLSCMAFTAGAHAAQSGMTRTAAGAQSEATASGSAQPPASSPARPASLGRLFYTPTERAQLDLARIQKKVPTPTQTASAEPVEAPPAPQIVIYGGLVRRSDGRQMLWINNRLVDEKEGLAELSLKGKVRPDGSVTLQVPQSNATVDVKVGQSVEVYTGKVAETRKPPPEAAKPAEGKGPADDAQGGATGAKPSAAEPKPPATAVKPPATESADRKPPPGGVGLKMDLGGRALSSEEAAQISRSK